MAAPGDLRDVELGVLGWHTEDGETALICRLVDGSPGTIPARWTDLPLRAPVEPPLGTVASPEAWRLWGERLAGLVERSRVGVEPPAENDDLGWPQRDGLKWPQLASVVVGVDDA